jgi:alkanesulfonate monooxygenase
VGSHREVADRIAEYHALGVEEFVMSGHPHVEEAYWSGEGVLPMLTSEGLWTHPAAQAAAQHDAQVASRRA